MKYPVLLLASLFILSACGGDGSDQVAPAASPAPSAGHGALSGMGTVMSSPQIGAPQAPAGSLRTGQVKETMTTAGYTYVQLDTVAGLVWVAGPAVAAEVGQRVETPNGQAMANFHSSSLERDFEEVWFVDFIRPEGSGPAAGSVASAHGAAPADSAHGGGAPLGAAPGGAASLAPASVEPLDGGQTVEAIFGKAAGDSVAVRGRLVKINRAILGFDWLHVMDGTGSAADKTDDLVVTAATGVQANVGDMVVIRGVVATDKDFGSGYTYPLLVQEASVTVE